MPSIGIKIGKLGGGSGSTNWTPQRNSDLVKVTSVGALSAIDGNALSATSTSGKGLSWFNYYREERIRQDGNIEKIIMNIGTITNIDLIEMYVMRYDGSLWDNVYTLNLLPLVVTGTNTLILSSPIPVLENDLIAYRGRLTGGADQWLGLSAQAGGGLYKDGIDAPAQNFNILGQTAFDFKNISHFYMQSPLLVTIGDSIMASHPLHNSLLDAVYTANDPQKSWQYKLRALQKECVYQNLGIGGNTTTQIEARFASQVVDAKPTIAVINGGINELAAGSIDVFRTNWISMINQSAKAGIIPVCWEIMPTAGSNALLQKRDLWNAALRFLVASCNTALIINWDSLLGVNRVGGDAGNLWDLNPALSNVDAVHLNEAGNQVVAIEMRRILKNAGKIVSDGMGCNIIPEASSLFNTDGTSYWTMGAGNKAWNAAGYMTISDVGAGVFFYVANILTVGHTYTVSFKNRSSNGYIYKYYIYSSAQGALVGANTTSNWQTTSKTYIADDTGLIIQAQGASAWDIDIDDIVVQEVLNP